MKRILILYYTQSGQLKNIVESLTSVFDSANYQLHFEELKPVQSYPFPWSAFTFFNAFPETFMQMPMDIQPVSDQAKDNFDLVILAYQPWFLTPSRPISSFLQSDDAKQILNNKNVITILGCRNMWLGAQEKVKRLLLNCNAKLQGHIALVDHSGNLTSVVTILRWMLYGKKDPFWIFPAAGIADKDVQHARVFGKIIKQSLDENNFSGLQIQLNAEGAIQIKPNLVMMEKRGQTSFSIWSKFIYSGGNVASSKRKRRVYVFMYALPTLILILSPILTLLTFVMLRVKKNQLQKEVEYFMQNTLR